MTMLGYKVLDEFHRNRYGKEFCLGESYHIDGTIQFGNNGCGYHFCLNFEDTLKYTESFTRNFTLARIQADGTIKESFDRYNGVYDIYVASDLTILSYLTEEEIFEEGLLLPPSRVKRFLQLYPLTEAEKKIFKKEYKHVELGIIQTFDYYQENNMTSFSEPYQYMEKTTSEMVKLKKWR